MRHEKIEKRDSVHLGKVELEIEIKLIDQLQAMEAHTKISKSDITATALKRFISQHKDYFPENYKF